MTRIWQACLPLCLFVGGTRHLILPSVVTPQEQEEAIDGQDAVALCHTLIHTLSGHEQIVASLNLIRSVVRNPGLRVLPPFLFSTEMAGVLPENLQSLIQNQLTLFPPSAEW